MKKPMNVTIEVSLLEKIKELAADEKRNLSNMVEVLLTEALESRDTD